MKNVCSLSINLDKPIFHKNINVFFSKYHDTHVGNTLLVDDTPYKNMFTETFNAIFLQSFHNFKRMTIICYGLFSFIENLFIVPNLNNPFGSIKSIIHNDF